MSVITLISICKKNKNRCNVYIDDEFCFSVYTDIAIKYGLKKGLNIDENLKGEIIREDGKIYAFNLGVNYLSKSLKTKRQIIDYLKRKGIDNYAIFSAIEKLEEYGYINDKEYVKRYLDTFSPSQGKRLADYKLMLKGVKKADIEEIRENYDEDSKQNALAIAQKRLKNKEITKENIQKTYRYIVGRGFSYEDASFAISFFKESEQE